MDMFTTVVSLIASGLLLAGQVLIVAGYIHRYTAAYLAGLSAGFGFVVGCLGPELIGSVRAGWIVGFLVANVVFLPMVLVIAALDRLKRDEQRSTSA